VLLGALADPFFWLSQARQTDGMVVIGGRGPLALFFLSLSPVLRPEHDLGFFLLRTAHSSFPVHDLIESQAASCLSTTVT